MSKKSQREKDEALLLELMDELEHIEREAKSLDKAVALAWKYLQANKRQALEIQALHGKE